MLKNFDCIVLKNFNNPFFSLSKNLDCPQLSKNKFAQLQPKSCLPQTMNVQAEGKSKTYFIPGGGGLFKDTSCPKPKKRLKYF